MIGGCRAKSLVARGNDVEAILAMSEKLHLSVVAEGVKTKQQAQLLKQASCNYLQGVLLQRCKASR